MEQPVIEVPPAQPSPRAVVPGLTLRSFVAGFLLAVLLCGINSYLTLSFGVIEEGPTIAALFFFAFFFASRLPITTTEMVIVATMGSAGGSLGFITNFYAAKAMTGEPYTFLQMTLFALVTSLVGMVFVVPLRELLVIKEDLPWPGSKATHGVISALVEEGDPRQPRYLLIAGLLAMAYVIANTDGGFGVVPDAVTLPLFGLGAFGAAVAISPFALGGAYLMGLRTCVGFFFGGVALLAMAPHLPEPDAPHHYVWPGIAFLVASGVTQMAINWRVITAAIVSLARLRPGADEDRPVSGRVLIGLALVALVFSTVVLVLGFDLSIPLVLMLIVVGGLIQNVIATRAAAQTAFNPARVMGVLMQGLAAAMGGASAATNLAGAGMVAGSGAQAGNLTGDMAYGRWFGVPSRWQFWTQFVTILPTAVVSAWVFTQIADSAPMTLDGEGLPAPVAKMWAASALVFDGTRPMPPFALEAMLIAGAAGIVYVLAEQRAAWRRFMPCSVGLGLGLVLPVAYDWAFFAGGLLMWVVGRRVLGVRDLTLTTIAVACIVAEGLGGVLKPVLTLAGLIPG